MLDRGGMGSRRAARGAGLEQEIKKKSRTRRSMAGGRKGNIVITALEAITFCKLKEILRRDARLQEVTGDWRAPPPSSTAT